MLKNFFPNKILSLNKNFFTVLIVIMISVIIVGLVNALITSPPDAVQEIQ